MVIYTSNGRGKHIHTFTSVLLMSTLPPLACSLFLLPTHGCQLLLFIFLVLFLFLGGEGGGTGTGYNWCKSSWLADCTDVWFSYCVPTLLRFTPWPNFFFLLGSVLCHIFWVGAVLLVAAAAGGCDAGIVVYFGNTIGMSSRMKHCILRPRRDVFAVDGPYIVVGHGRTLRMMMGGEYIMIGRASRAWCRECETMPTTDRHSCGCAVKRGEDEQRRLGVSLLLYYCLLFRLSMNNGMCSAAA